jgi:hypothetical protein
MNRTHVVSRQEVYLDRIKQGVRHGEGHLLIATEPVVYA